MGEAMNMYGDHGEVVPDGEPDDEDGDDDDGAKDPQVEGGEGVQAHDAGEAAGEQGDGEDQVGEQVGGAELSEPEVRPPDAEVERDFRITKKLVQIFGPTANCRSCEIPTEARGGKPASHTPECRRRFEAAMQDDDRFRGVLKRRGARHGLADEEAQGESDDEPSAKRLRIIEEPPVAAGGSDLSGADVFAPSDMMDSGPSAQAEETPVVQPSSGGEEPPEKKPRIGSIDSVADRVMKEVLVLAKRYGVEGVDALGSREEARRIMNDLDEAYTRKLRRRARKVIYRTGSRTQKKPILGVGEAYCPARLTEVAAEFGLEPQFALDLTVIDPTDGLAWDFDQDAIQEKALERMRCDDPGAVLLSPSLTSSWKWAPSTFS